MTADLRTLIDGYLDDCLSPEQEAELSQRMQLNPHEARLFAEAVRMHDALRNAFRLTDEVETRPRSNRSPSRRAWQPMAVLTGITASVVFIVWWAFSSRVNAAGELERLIQSPSVSADRTYRITKLDGEAETPKGRQAPLDGATLHVRSPDKYVLIRRFADGRKFVTGFDGVWNWSAPPDGAVRLSQDPWRFRGPLPGHHHGIPFADLRSDLVEIRDAYHLRRLSIVGGLNGLTAERKSPEHRGPRRVELWYDANTKVVRRMVFTGLPQARGGPSSLAVDLIEQAPLAADFFQHHSHHAPDRRVIEED